MIEEMVRKHPLLMILKRFVSSKELASPNVFMRRFSHHYPEKQYITMETLPLCPLPLCHHRCQSWKNLGSLYALWCLRLCNRKGHQSPTDPFRETGITTETSENEKRMVPKPNQNKSVPNPKPSSQASWKLLIIHPSGYFSVKAEWGQIF